MNERFDVEVVLRDVLAVLRRHNIPVETASLNVSLLDAAFDELIPQRTSHKAGAFQRSMVVDGVPVVFRAQRRYPFDGVVRVLEYEIRPPIEAFAEALRQEYPDLNIEFASASTTPTPGRPHPLYLHSYRLGIDCQFSDDVHADYNQLNLPVCLQQGDATECPRLSALVGWLVDEESGGDWGLDVVFDGLGQVGDYAPYQVDKLRGALAACFERFRNEIVRRRLGDRANLDSGGPQAE